MVLEFKTLKPTYMKSVPSEPHFPHLYNEWGSLKASKGFFDSSEPGPWKPQGLLVCTEPWNLGPVIPLFPWYQAL